MGIIALSVPLILASIKLDLQLFQLKGAPITLLSPSRNISLHVVGQTLFADSVAVTPLQVNQVTPLSIECLSDSSVFISSSISNALIHSPSICTKAHGILIDETTFNGCISNLYRDGKLLLPKLCGNADFDKNAPPVTTFAPGTLQPVYVAEQLEVNEGGSMPLQWKNVYVLPEHSRLNISNHHILFSVGSIISVAWVGRTNDGFQKYPGILEKQNILLIVVEGPQHGQLTLEGQTTSAFNYGDVLSRSVIYKHDGSETAYDSFEFQLEINNKAVDFPWLETAVYTLKIKINAVNDAPELTEAKQGQIIKISAKGRRVLSPEQVLLFDPDDGPDKVRVQVVESRGVHLQVANETVTEFTQRQLINRQVYLADEGLFEKGLLRFVARDRDSRSQVLTLHTVSTPIEVTMRTNTGIKLLHHAAVTINANNLSFSASVPDVPLVFSLVDMPDHGIVECSPDDGHFSVCSSFTQQKLDSGLVRFRHTSNNNPTHDTFSFQVESGDFVSMIHHFRITFIPMNVKVFNREVFLLNGTEVGILDRANLFAWTFPKSFAAEKLVYHIEEPPKYGILSRKLANGKRNRRIGVSSNFTQKDIDDGLIEYKLHFMQFSIVNDYFLFRVVTPSVSSEPMRFEIVFVPSQSSIQLVNRTVVVQEGQVAPITSDFLALTTSDDTYFTFTVTIPPTHGQLLLKMDNGGKRILSHGTNFSTKNIADERLLYSHSGSESRSDRVYLTAESAFKSGRRIPLWLSFSIILTNDNAPRLESADELQMVERGERVLWPHLLNWIDDDIDAASLKFEFQQNMKDAAILSRVSPYLPTTSFNSNDLKEGKIMIRHLGHKSTFSMGYTVTDGKHLVSSSLKVVASDPFVRMRDSSLEYCCLPGDTPQIDVTTGNLSVLTNLDVRPSEVVFSVAGSGFMLRTNKAWKPVNRFTQKDVSSGDVSYLVHGVDKEQLSVRVGERTLAATVTITRRSLGSTLELKKNVGVSLPVGGATVIDNNHLEQGDGSTTADRLWFHVVKQPQDGTLVLEKDGDSASAQRLVTRFSQQELDLGRLQYLHGGSGAGRDSMDINITSPHVTKGPYTLYIDIFEHYVTLNTEPLNIVSGSSGVVSATAVNVSSSDRDDYMVKIISPPQYGWLVKDSWSLGNISSIESFTGADLRERRVVYVSDKAQTATRDEFRISACISRETCTDNRIVDVMLVRRNVQSPHLIRNEVLRVSGEKHLITSLHLDTEDPDTSPDSVFFLISRPSNGIVVNVNEIDVAVYNFSQRQIDDNQIAFVRSSGSSASGGGFSFLLTDGVHQIGPEWFSIESWSSSSPVLEANSRLQAAPSAQTLIGIELLRANLPNARPEEVLYSVTKQPKFGRILVNGRESDKFSQNDINRKQLVYSSVNEEQKEWSRKDSFSFVISRNGTARPVDEEFRFRISSTYAALNENLSKFVSVSPMQLSRGGSCALNSSHLSIAHLMGVVSSEVLLLEVAKQPRHGTLEWLEAGRGVVSLSEFRKGVTAVYKHDGEDGLSDSIMFYIYPISETTRRSSRLRVTVPITVTTLRDPLVQIVNFVGSVSLLSGGQTELTSTELMATHPHVPPQSIVYEVVQAGVVGVSVRVDGYPKKLFSQEEVNAGAVSLFHQSVDSAASNSDVIVMSVEGHTRALVVRTRPLDLALENHTVIEYPQGKTYVVLNRTHLGAYSNGADRSKITYKISQPPENGTFYWVAGEKEAKEFTQQDLDEGRLLYAQLNMHSFQDSFEFILGNGDREMMRNISIIRVKPLVEPQPLIVETNSLTPLTASQLNASMLQGSTPRFLVSSQPKYGRITLDPGSNLSALFFTFPDILRGRVYYQAFDHMKEVTELLELEVRADSVQPARLILPITIIPSEIDAEAVKEQNTGNAPTIEVPRMVKSNDNIVLIMILILIISITVGLMVCRNNKKKKSKIVISMGTPPRLPPTPPESEDSLKQDILGSTVFATVARSESIKRTNVPPTQAVPPIHMRNPLAGTPIRHAPPSLKSFEPATPASKRRMEPSLDYAGLTGDTPPVMPLFKQIHSKQGENQYWV